MMTVIGSRACVHQARCLSVEAFKGGNCCVKRVTVASHRLSTTKKETIFPSELGFMCLFQRPCLHNSHIRCCLQLRESGGFVRREWNAFSRLRQALIRIQTTNALGPRPRPSSTHTQPFRPVRVMDASM